MLRVPIRADELLDKEFLDVRAKILEVAATIDRIDRAEGDVENDPRTGLLEKALGELASREVGRAERVQMIFSLPYIEEWRKTKG